MSAIRTDAKEAGTFLSRQLEQTLPKLYEKRYPKLWADDGMYLPATGNLEEGAREIVEEMVTTVGEAAILSDQADDIPLVDVSIDESKFKAFNVVVGYNYTIPELNAAAKAGRDINSVRIFARDRAMRERVHRLAVFGSPKHGAAGFFSNPNVPLVNSSYDADDAGTTAQDHIDFVADNLTLIEDDTNLVEGIDTILVPPKLHNAWAKATLSGTSDTVIKHLLENWGTSAGGTLRRIAKSNECRSELLERYGIHAGGTNKDRIMFLPSNPDAVERLFYPMVTMEPQRIGLNYSTFSYCGTSEPIFHYPGSCLYVDIPKVN